MITGGGARPNVVPDTASVLYYVRAPSYKEAITLCERLEKYFHGAALATECDITINRQRKIYFNMTPNKSLCSDYASNVAELGCPMTCNHAVEPEIPYSTDAGNVSYEYPTLHVWYGVETPDATYYNHTPAFAAVAASADAFERTLVAAKALAMTGLRVLINDAFYREVKSSFDDDVAQRNGQ